MRVNLALAVAAVASSVEISDLGVCRVSTTRQEAGVGVFESINVRDLAYAGDNPDAEDSAKLEWERVDEWLGVIPERDLPCKHGEIGVTACEGDFCPYPYTALYSATTNFSLTPWPAQYATSRGSSGFLQWLPKGSCAVKGCLRNSWYTPDQERTCFVNTQFAGEDCYCDDACTNFEDCCFDYQWECAASTNLLRTSTYVEDSGVETFMSHRPEVGLGHMDFPWFSLEPNFRSPATYRCVAVPDYTANSVHAEGVGYISNFPCSIGNVYLERCSNYVVGLDGFEQKEENNCLYPVTARTSALMIGVTPWPMELDGSTFTWIPLHSCRDPARGCTKLTWTEQNTNGDLGYCFSEALQSDSCYCDDACTRYKDCCYDYAYTCDSGKGINTAIYGELDYVSLMA